MYRNICLLGLPHSGKTTLGRELYKYLGKGFIDTDNIIRARYKQDIPELLHSYGRQKYLEIEQSVITSLQVHNNVIATGSSVIYEPESMKHLQERLDSKICYLYLSKNAFLNRISKVDKRGIVMKKHQYVQNLYNESTPLYEQYADQRINACQNIDMETLRPTYHERYANNISFIGYPLSTKPLTTRSDTLEDSTEYTSWDSVKGYTLSSYPCPPL